MTRVPSSDVPEVSLEEERQELVRHRLLRAGRIALRDIGSQLTVEEVAGIAKVSRRTVFRYFPTRDDLLKAIIESAIDEYTDGLPATDGQSDLEPWLRELCRRVHELNSSLGPGYWEFLVTRHDPGPIADVFAARLKQRRNITDRLAAEAWRLSGKSGKPPASLAPTIALVLAPLTTATLLIDASLEIDQAAELSYQLLRAAIEDLPVNSRSSDGQRPRPRTR